MVNFADIVGLRFEFCDGHWKEACWGDGWAVDVYDPKRENGRLRIALVNHTTVWRFTSLPMLGPATAFYTAFNPNDPDWVYAAARLALLDKDYSLAL